MNAVIDFYQQQIAAHRTESSHLAALQAAGAHDFIQKGFPNRHDEEWKYTKVDSFLLHQFPKQAVGRSLDFNAEALDASVIVQPLQQALHEHADKLKPYLGQILKSEHGFHALNTALISDGLLIYLPANACLTEPLRIKHYPLPGQALYLRHVVIAEEGSSATIIEEYYGETQTCYFTNTITEVHLAAHAKLTHYKVQKESHSAFHFSHLISNQAEHSELTSHLANLGGQWVRTDSTFNLNASHARCMLNGVYLPDDGQHIDQHTIVNHNVSDCYSEQDYKGIMHGRSHAVFNGKVIVAPHAQRTEAHQQNKNLLLSKHAEVDTKPQLEIYADDVVCSHGATVGQLDEEALFYLASRGIERRVASRYLVQAFIAENLARMPYAKLNDELEHFLLPEK